MDADGISTCEDTPDINFDQDTPDLNFTEQETPDLNFTEEQHVTETEDEVIDDNEAEAEETHNDEIENETENQGTNESDRKTTENRQIRLPLSRIKTLMKNDPDVSLVPNESAFLVAKATELFIESLARESFVHTARAKKKTVQKRDVDLAIGTVDALTFLEGAMDF